MRSADRYPPLFVEATQSTRDGGIAGPVRSGAGFHVLKVLAKAPGAAAGDAVVTQTQVRHILLRTDPQAHRRRRRVAQLAEFKQRHRRPAPADFAGLARDNSQDGSAKDGGDLGWAQPGPVRARVRGGDEPPGAGPDQRSGGVALRRAPDPGAWRGATPS